MIKNYSVKIGEKKFKKPVSKDAYLAATIWLAKNVYGRESYSKCVSVQITKDEPVEEDGEMLYGFTVSLFFNESFDEMKNSHCNACKQASNLFLSSNPNCQECKFNAFMRKAEYETETMVNNLKERFSV